MLAECPKFQSAPSGSGSGDAPAGTRGDYIDQGLARHKAIAAYLAGDEKALDTFKDDERDNLLWAADYIKMKAPLADYPLIIETPRKATLPNGEIIQGTPDIVCGPELFDLKWRPRDYKPQMACYAWMIMDGGVPAPVHAHLLFAQLQTHRILTFDADSAWATIKPILENVTAPFAVATPCTFCGWCAKKLTCEALIQQVNIALKSNPEWDLPQWHSSEMNTAQQMGQALKIARTLADWCDSVEFHAKEMAVKQGIVATGFTLKSRQGNRVIDDVVGAFQRANLPQAEFLKACSVKPKSLFELYAAFHGMKKAPAEREVEQKLGEVIKRKEPTQMLVQEKEKD
jgi:hypothetical protein